MTEPTSQQVLDLELPANDSGETTVRGYLVKLIALCWTEEISSKRPFGNSGWQNDLYVPMIKAGFVPGVLDEDGLIENMDEEMADRLIMDAIAHLGAKPKQPATPATTEIAAMQKAMQALAVLDPDALSRALAWLNDRFER